MSTAIHPKHEAFIDTLTALLDPKQTNIQQQDVILSKSRQIEKQIDEENLEERAKALLAKERISNRDLDHISPSITFDMMNKNDTVDKSDQNRRLKGWRVDHEKQLRKVATRGVVKLFNALKVQKEKKKQLQTAKKSKLSAQAPVIVNAAEKARIAAASKDAFLQYLKKSSGQAASTQAAPAQQKWAALEQDKQVELEDWDEM